MKKHAVIFFGAIALLVPCFSPAPESTAATLAKMRSAMEPHLGSDESYGGRYTDAEQAARRRRLQQEDKNNDQGRGSSGGRSDGTTGGASGVRQNLTTKGTGSTGGTGTSTSSGSSKPTVFDVAGERGQRLSQTEQSAVSAEVQAGEFARNAARLAEKTKKPISSKDQALHDQKAQALKDLEKQLKESDVRLSFTDKELTLLKESILKAKDAKALAKAQKAVDAALTNALEMRLRVQQTKDLKGLKPREKVQAFKDQVSEWFTTGKVAGAKNGLNLRRAFLD